MLVLVEVAMSPYNNPLLCRCWDSIDARTATPTRLSFKILEKVAGDYPRSAWHCQRHVEYCLQTSLNDRGHLVSVDYLEV